MHQYEFNDTKQDTTIANKRTCWVGDVEGNFVGCGVTGALVGEEVETGPVGGVGGVGVVEAEV